MSTLLAHVTGQDMTAVVTAFVLGLILGGALVLSRLRQPGK